MTRADLSSALVAAVRAAVAEGELSVAVPDEAPLTWAKAGVCGSPLALRLAKEAGLPAAEVAAIITTHLADVGDVSISEGFIAIREEAPGAEVDRILEAGERQDRTAESPNDGRTAGLSRNGGTARFPGGGGAAGRAGGGMAGFPRGGSTAGLGDDRCKGGFPRPEKPWADRPRRFETPGFSVRFAYARAVATGRRARDLKIEKQKAEERLKAPEEIRLVGLLAEFPARVRLAERKQSAGPLVRHLEWTAEAYHDVYERCPALPVGDQAVDVAHGARVALAEAVEITLRNGLLMLGENPRERL